MTAARGSSARPVGGDAMAIGVEAAADVGPDRLRRWQSARIGQLTWSGRWPLSVRILAVNVLAIALLVGGFLYLDSFRTRLVDARLIEAGHDLALVAAGLRALEHDGPASVAARDQMLADMARARGTRIRLFGASGDLVADSFAVAPPTYRLADPAEQPWRKSVARTLDRAVEWIVRAPAPEPFSEPAFDRAEAWPELARLSPAKPAAGVYRIAPDRTPVISAARLEPSLEASPRLLLTLNARDITRTVRTERLRLGLILAGTIAASVLLSLFLARTIVSPLRALAAAAVQVRQGRAREVIVPRLPDRRDEIGTLARAVSDMTQALRARIDAGEHFAADVAHELKNPIASLRSAIEGMGIVGDGPARQQLMAIAADDVRRLDRLVTDIAEASRMDAEISRTRFERVDIGAMIEGMLSARRLRAELALTADGPDADGVAASPRIAFARPRLGTTVVMGDARRLERAIGNLIDNAVSFARPGGLVRVSATCVGPCVRVRVEDDGPGIAPDQRETVFRRFHTVRPEQDAFGRHSGLGLAIARTIIEAHDGRIAVVDSGADMRGARFELLLPVAPDGPAP